jgi:HEAT repeat protein
VSSRLASLLVQDGQVTAQRMAEAFQRQVIYGGTLDTIVLEMGLVEEEVLLDYLGRAAELPVLVGPAPEPQPGQDPPTLWLPASLADRFHVAPVGLEGKRALIMVNDPADREKLKELGDLLRMEVEPWVVPEYRLHQARERIYGVALPARFASLSRRLRQRAEQREARARAATGPVATAPPPQAPPPRAPDPPPRAPDPPTPQAAVSEPPRADAVPQPIEEKPAARYRVEPPRPAPAPVAPPAPAPSLPPDPTEPGPTSPLTLDEGLRALQAAEDRDAIFVTLCRIARARFPFSSLFTVQNERATARVGLADTWVPRDVIDMTSVPLDVPSSFRATIVGRTPYLGLLDDDPPTSQAMAMLGRRHQLRGALLPVVMRDRTVALIQVDDNGRAIDVAELADLVTAVAAAASAFQRLILRAKAGKMAKAPSVPAPRAHAQEAPVAALGGEERKTDLRKRAPAHFDAEETDPGHRRVMRDPRAAEDAIAALDEILRGGAGAAPAIERLVALGPEGARALAQRLPGPLSLERHAVDRQAPLPLAEHGPLLRLVPRFGEAIVPHLVARLSDASLDVRYYATMCLGEVRLAAAIAPLGARLFDLDPAVRAAAASALGRYEPGPDLRALVESLRSELLSPDAARQRHAAEAVGELRDAISVPRLIELVKHREPDVVEAARRALLQITKQDFGNSRWRWRSWWDRNREVPRLEWLLAGLDHREAEVRTSASEELAVVSTDHFGFHRDLPRPEREEARQKWLAWYKQSGA